MAESGVRICVMYVKPRSNYRLWRLGLYLYIESCVRIISSDVTRGGASRGRTAPGDTIQGVTPE